MVNGFDNGAIIAKGKFFESADYDAANYAISVRFDGKGGVCYYALADGKTFDRPIGFLNVKYNGKIIDARCDKTVTMIGRTQIIALELENAELIISQFLSEKDNAIFLSYELLSENSDDKAEIGVTGAFFERMSQSGNRYLEAEEKSFCASGNIEYIAENSAVYFCLTGKTRGLRAVLSCGRDECVKELREVFDEKLRAVKTEFEAISLPDGLNDVEKSLYYSAYYCSLENYRERGEFKGFTAGCRYLSPLRTYYRDSYYAALPMYNGNADKVKNEIVTLARGIHIDGSCPSAVRSDFSDWWGDHYDSPSLFAIMLGDYVKITGDKSIVDISSGGKTVFEKAVLAVERLSGFADRTGLIVKAGRYNKRDWADEVNRYGYVTYDEILFCRALYMLSELFAIKGDDNAARLYKERSENVKRAINEILWDNEKGYYVNFINEDYVEDNLSADTFFAILFDIADKNQAESMLRKGEELLETANNGAGEDFGCMCVYPFYKSLYAANNKSTQPFNYHNGACWLYLTAVYACAKRKYGKEYRKLLTTVYEYNLNKGNYTLIEYFSPYCADGSLLQAWSGAIAFALDDRTIKFTGR